VSKIKVNDLTIYYEISGTGSPLVLLPGMLGTIESNWRRFIPALAKHYCTIAIDLRGHGRSDNPDPSGKSDTGKLCIGQMADDLNSVLDELELKKVSVLGYSLGGCIGLLAGLKRPGHIQALVMHAVKFFWDEASISSMVAGLNPITIFEKTPRYAQKLKENHEVVYGPEYWRTLLSAAADLIKTMPEQGPTIEQAAGANFPVLVSVGDHDQLVSLEEAIRLVRVLPKGELAVLPATPHPFQRVRVDSFLPILLDFLERSSKLDMDS
jgi:pimeloyl-ACP methyl ester carboxylesterase